MSEIDTTYEKQNNSSTPIDEHEGADTPPPEYTSRMDIGQPIQSEALELESCDTQVKGVITDRNESQNMTASAKSMMSDTTTPFPQPVLNDSRGLSGSVESAQSGTVIQNASTEEMTEFAPQQTVNDSQEHDESSPWVRVLRSVWPKGARQRRKRLTFVGKFEIILGMYFLFFGVTAVIVTNQVYKSFFITACGAVAGYGLLLLITGSCKVCTSPSKGNVVLNTVLSFICFLGGGGLTVWCIFVLLNIDPGFSRQWDHPYMISVAAGTSAAAALICLLHVACYCKGKGIPLERVQIIVSTNTRTGEKFFETWQPRLMERSESRQEVNEQSYPGSSQDIMPYIQQPGILMSNIGRSTSMRTIQNQFVERTNHELPQHFHTVHRNPITMQQHRQQEMKYATSEFNSTHPVQMSYGKGRSFDQPGYVNMPADTDYGQPRAMTEINYPRPRTIVSQQYAQSEIGPSRAITEIDYPQSRTIPTHQYAQSEIGHSAGMAEVDYEQQRAVLGEQYANSEIGQPRTVTQNYYPQPQTISSHQFAQSDMGHPRAMSDVDHQHFRTMPKQYSVPPEMMHPRSVTVTEYSQPGPTPHHQHVRPEVSRPSGSSQIDQLHSMTTPSRQYNRSEITYPATVARPLQYTSETSYQVNMPHIPYGQNIDSRIAQETSYPPASPEYRPMQGQMHPQAEMGFRTVPPHAVAYQAAPSEAGYSYTPSESGYPSNQAGRISPRMALAERQLRMEAARQESLLRRQPPTRNGSQQYMVATRQYR